ncbi:MAG TPA: hypothetical protein DD435_01445 [Cyanobacteria bacterium UBA8530]|nr:hypothetical protein [Cyanobacteria bacterium UBA8530]
MGLSFASIFAIGHHFVRVGHLEALRQMHREQALFLGHEVESALREGRDARIRLRELDRILHTESRFVPGGRLVEKLKFEPSLSSLQPWAVSWVRVDSGGATVGSIRTRFSLRIMRGGMRPVGVALLYLFQLILMIVIPLVAVVIRPLRQITRTAERLGKGDLDTPIPVLRRDEFGELEEAFEGMRKNLKATMGLKDRFLRDVSHELRSPLTRLSVALSLVRKGNDTFFPQMERDLSFMDSLIGQLLDLARIQAPELGEKDSACDLGDIAGELLRERALLFDQKGLSVERKLEKAVIRGNSALLRRAIGNLLDNAIQYGRNEGRLRVETSGARVLVWNEGEPIPPEDLDRLFEPFYRPDSSRSRRSGGTGLGLSIVGAIVEKHGGSTEIRSDDGGTTVELNFPLVQRG